MFDPAKIAVSWYFGELCHEDLPGICIDALDHGYDGPMLRRLAGLTKPTSRDIQERQIKGAFQEMGIAAPISEMDCQLFLATETAEAAVEGGKNVFDAATHIRIHVCKFKPQPAELSEIVRLSEESELAPRLSWGRLEKKIKEALATLAKGELKPRVTRHSTSEKLDAL